MTHPGGRPLKFQSVEELQKKIDKYFEDTPAEEITVTGLALALGTTRDTLISYQEKPEFIDSIKNAKERVHAEYEKDLRKKGRSGDIFALKNFGWRDERSVDMTSKGESVKPSADVDIKLEALRKEFEEKLRQTI